MRPLQVQVGPNRNQKYYQDPKQSSLLKIRGVKEWGQMMWKVLLVGKLLCQMSPAQAMEGEASPPSTSLAWGGPQTLEKQINRSKDVDREEGWVVWPNILKIGSPHNRKKRDENKSNKRQSQNKAEKPQIYKSPS